jgi:hypothetical protein
MGTTYYIGWDVGGWNCDKNSNSRDAIIVLDKEGNIISSVKARGNLRTLINTLGTGTAFIQGLFAFAAVPLPFEETDNVVLAIDTPLGYSTEFIDLITEYKLFGKIGDFQENRYLFRATERFLYERGHTPLSAVNHMIGAQSTKGIHVISKFARKISEIGVWQDADKKLRIIETYPALHKEMKIPMEKINSDVEDAYRCACIAEVFDKNKNLLHLPSPSVPEKEGWIWFLR